MWVHRQRRKVYQRACRKEPWGHSDRNPWFLPRSAPPCLELWPSWSPGTTSPRQYPIKTHINKHWKGTCVNTYRMRGDGRETSKKLGPEELFLLLKFTTAIEKLYMNIYFNFYHKKKTTTQHLQNFAFYNNYLKLPLNYSKIQQGIYLGPYFQNRTRTKKYICILGIKTNKIQVNSATRLQKVI